MAGFKAQKWIVKERKERMVVELEVKEFDIYKKNLVLDLNEIRIKDLDEAVKMGAIKLNVKEYYRELEVK
jgi:hypothetical protein